jgi:hypothetical protein
VSGLRLGQAADALDPYAQGLARFRASHAGGANTGPRAAHEPLAQTAVTTD